MYKTELAPILLKLYEKAQQENKLPDSLNEAIIKLLPKNQNAERIEDWRPLSLINTDFKILAIILTQRLQPVLGKIIEQDQTAHLKNRNAHTNISITKNLIDLATLNNESLAIISTDFEKAFDRVDRNFMHKLLTKIGIPENIRNYIALIYQDTTAKININGFLTREIATKRGVRQGCPLSALLYILVLEVMLEKIRNDTRLDSPTIGNTTYRLGAFADDVTIYIKNNSIIHVEEIIQEFCEGTQFKLNPDKTKILTIGNTHFDHNFQNAQTIKILGVNFPITDHKMALQNIANKCATKINWVMYKNMTLRGRAIALNVYISNTLLYTARHLIFNMEIITNLQNQIKNKLWRDNTHHYIRETILYRNTSEGGVKLPNLKHHIDTAQLSDIVHMCTSENTTKALILAKYCYSRTEFYRKFNARLGYNHKKLISMNQNNCTIQYIRIHTVLTSEMRFRDIHDNFIRAENQHKVIERLTTSVQRYNTTHNALYKCAELVWKLKYIPIYYKDMYYKLIYNIYPDRDWQARHGLANSPICRFCNLTNENKAHLIFECNTLHIQRLRYQIHTWDDVFPPFPTKQQLRRAVLYTCTILMCHDKSYTTCRNILHHFRVP